MLLIFPLLIILCWWSCYLYCRVQITCPRANQIVFFLSVVLADPPILQSRLNPLQWGQMSSWMNLGCTGCVSKCLLFNVHSFLRHSCQDTADSSFMPWAVTYLWPKQNLFPPWKWTDELGSRLQAQQRCCRDTPWILLLSHFSFPLPLLLGSWRKQWWE